MPVYKIIKQKLYVKFIKKTKNFYSIGRQGQFYYGDIDQMARFGFDTATEIIKEKK